MYIHFILLTKICSKCTKKSSHVCVCKFNIYVETHFFCHMQEAKHVSVAIKNNSRKVLITLLTSSNMRDPKQVHSWLC